MNISLLKTRGKSKGLTLVEVIVSLAILGLIIIPLLNMFVFSALTNKRSEDILDATYIAQSIIETRYAEHKTDGTIPAGGEYTDPFGGGYWIGAKVETDGGLIRIIIKVYSDNTKRELKAQMETYLLNQSQCI